MLFQQIQKAKWINRKQNRLSIVLCCLLTCFCGSSFAEIVIGVVGKTKNDSFYEQSFKGCEEFAKDYKDVRCIYDGPQDYQDIRSQTIIVNELVEKEINGLLISTTDSEFLVKGALSSMHIGKIPVITFDSDLLPKHEKYRLAYVGTNNFNFGEALGNYVKQFGQSELNSICLQSGHPTTPNLNERIAGIRYALSGQNDERLSGQNGWIEYARSTLQFR